VSHPVRLGQGGEEERRDGLSPELPREKKGGNWQPIRPEEKLVGKEEKGSTHLLLHPSIRKGGRRERKERSVV